MGFISRHRLGEKKSFLLEKTDPTFYTPFLFIKYSKTTHWKHHIHVIIQNVKKRGIFSIEKNYGAFNRVVRDSSVVRRHYILLLEPSNVRAQYIRKTADLPHPAQVRHISTFRGYRILLTIRNPYINRFTNHFSIHS
jgi:hypothetical protein